MMPSYKYMGSNSNQENQMPWMSYQHPSFGPFPKMDSSRPPFAYDSWPYASYPNTAPSHVCCNHNFPGFYAPRPPCAHFQPGPPCQWYGNYTPYHEAVHMPSPPHYPPSFEYDKDCNGNYHCCGFPNHTHDQRKASSVKIEEHEPEVEKKVCDPFFPGQMKNYPYPVMWVPPEYRNVVPCDMKPSEQEPWNGWFANDMNRLQSYLQGKRLQSQKDEDKSRVESEDEKKVLNKWFPFPFNLNDLKMPEEDGKRKLDQQNVDKSDKFPFPVIWMPSSNKQEEVEKDNDKVTNDASKTAGEKMPLFRFIPVNRSSENKLKPDEEKNKDQFKDAERRGSHVPVEQNKNNKADEPVKAAAKKDLASSPKASKLPPVCLRVDPVPTKKNGNVKPRSPRPPVIKERAEKIKGANSSEVKDEYKKGVPVTKEHKIKNIKVVDASDTPTKEAELGTFPHAQVHGQISERMDMGSGEVKEESAKVTTAEETTMTNKVQENKLKRKLSELEAAVLIQSAFRGFQVRKWEPLKKLRQLAIVQEQMAEVKTRVQALESSVDLRRDNKQKLMIGEMIMNLLLKLDAIQGLNPSLRDIRKALAKELTFLQEKIDALMTNKPESTAEVFTETPTSNRSVETVQNKEEANVCVNHCENSTDINEIEIEKEQEDQTLLPPVADVSGSEDEIVPIVESCKEEEQVVSEEQEDQTLLPPIADVSGSENEIVPIVESCKEEEQVMSEEQEDQTLLPPIADVSGSENEIIPVVESCKEEEQVMSENEVLFGSQAEAKEVEEIQPQEFIDDGSCIPSVDANSNLLAELPVDVIDEATTEKSENLELKSDEAQLISDEKCNGPSLVSQSEQMHAESEASVKVDNCVNEEELPGGKMIETEIDQSVAKEQKEDDMETHLSLPRMITADTNIDERKDENQMNEVNIPCVSDFCTDQDIRMSVDEQVPDIVSELTATFEEEVQKEKPEVVNEQVPDIVSELTATFEEGVQKEKPEVVNNVTDNSTEVSMITTQASDQQSVGEKQVSSPQSVSVSQVSEKLIEENEKLREMMEKLMLAGTKQIDAISKLTGRVQDLEKKLSRKKKLKMRSHRKPSALSS